MANDQGEPCGICDEMTGDSGDYEAWLQHRMERHAEPEEAALENWYQRYPDERPAAADDDTEGDQA